MNIKRRRIANFEARSVALIAIWTFGAVAAVHAQQTAPAAAERNAPAAVVGPGATPTNTDTQATFVRADANKDGKVSRAEAERFPAVAQRFDQFDANKDNFLSPEEFDKAIRP